MNEVKGTPKISFEDVLSYVHSSGKITAAGICKHFGLSKPTGWRYIKLLEKKGVIRRIVNEYGNRYLYEKV